MYMLRNDLRELPHEVLSTSAAVKRALWRLQRIRCFVGCEASQKTCGTQSKCERDLNVMLHEQLRAGNVDDQYSVGHRKIICS